MNEYLLSICIPTFNRADFLTACLESIVSQLADEKVKVQVEIVVSDNHSSDSTEEVVRQFLNTCPNIVYKKNISNLGVDRNILQAVEMSHGKFVWLLGDDDTLFPDALAYVVDLLEKKQADYYIANCWGYNKTLTQKALNRPNNNLVSDKFYIKLSDYVIKARHDQNLIGLFCGLSVQIFLKEPWMEFSGKEEFIGTNAIHLHILMTVMKNRKFAILAKPCVKVRSDNIRWEVFVGLETLKKRAEMTKKTLLWILKEYKIPYSKIKIQAFFSLRIFVDQLKIFLRKYILTNQKSRDVFKKLLGKL